MSIEAHKCNVKDCNGLVVFENADFDYQNPEVMKGIHAFDNPTCNTCGKEFLVVPTHTVIDWNEETYESEEIETACISDWYAHKML